VICAICTSANGPFTREPLGKNDAMVNVCTGCSSGAPVRQGPERGYEVREGVSWAETRRRLATLERPFDRYASGQMSLMQTKTPGFVVERIQRRQGGRILDRNEAERIVQAMPCGSHARYLGADVDSFLFERPPEVSLSTDTDILEDLRRLEGKGR
jgi:hypothetical protein